jgi:hypothetical protein
MELTGEQYGDGRGHRGACILCYKVIHLANGLHGLWHAVIGNVKQGCKCSPVHGMCYRFTQQAAAVSEIPCKCIACVCVNVWNGGGNDTWSSNVAVAPSRVAEAYGSWWVHVQYGITGVQLCAQI